MDWQSFFRNQLDVWPQVASRYEGLTGVRTRLIRTDGGLVRVDYNPARARSTGAKVDKETLATRRCFLCATARPSEQFAMDTHLPGLEDYDILVNPFPILNPHFTIASRSHRPQDIPDAAMLAAARAFPDLVFFYNGPLAGASAPDHAHFQAVGWFVPRPPVRHEVFSDAEAQWTVITDRCRKAEGLFNLFVYQHDSRTEALFIPRRAHRPRCYPDLMISPGALDVAGRIITVRETDFKTLDAAILRDIYADTCFL